MRGRFRLGGVAGVGVWGVGTCSGRCTFLLLLLLVLYGLTGAELMLPCFLAL